MEQDAIKVVVRVRPLNAREISQGKIGLIKMEGINTYLSPPQNSKSKEIKSFAFDKSYWSACAKGEPNYADQNTVYQDLGKDLLNHAFTGFNCCIFAYGQTGSGKSYSMMGYGEDRGIIPLICESLFERIEKLTQIGSLTFTVEVSYTEIYQERVRDLLNPANKNLKVREHPILGPYVENLSKLAVQNFSEVENLMEAGTKARTVASTAMNETSSRSHAIFTLLLTQKQVEMGIAIEKVSRISLVDLAGSERANATGATGIRLKEGALINKSLTTLGRVISALASSSQVGPQGKMEKVPYRDSVLTWLLKPNLGGNSKTAMIAAISPADYEETLSTLRYADAAKKIKNKAVVNEDETAKLIRELKEELATLRLKMTGTSIESFVEDPSIPPEQRKEALQDQLEASESLMAEVSKSWEEKLAQTQIIALEREKQYEALGITVDKDSLGIHTSKKMPNLVNLNEDPLMSECLVYQLKNDKTTVGNSSFESSDIRLSGSSILEEHAHFNFESGVVTLVPGTNAVVMVNGMRINGAKELRSGFRIIMGDLHVFRFNHPEEVRKARELGTVLSLEESNSAHGTRNESPISTTENNVDWAFARREVLQLNGAEVELDQLKNEDLDKLFASVLRVRHFRNPSTFSSSERPESRMSYLDSVTEDGDETSDRIRPFSGGTWSTAETSLGDSLTAREVDEQIRAVRDDYDEKIKIMMESTIEKEEMEIRLKSLEEELITEKKRTETRGRKLKGKIVDIPLTAQEIRLAKAAVIKWKRLSRVRMAEDLLKTAVLLKEANIISIQLNKSVDYQFIILNGPVNSSAICNSLFGEIEEISDYALLNSSATSKPFVAVKVLDYQHSTISIWSLSEMSSRLEKMRKLYNTKAEILEHFTMDSPFYSTGTNSDNHYSLVGFAGLSLAPLSRSLPSTFSTSISSPYMIDSIGTARIRIKSLSVTLPGQESTGYHPSIARFDEGSKLEFEIIVDRVIGFDRAEFASLHIQINLSSFFGSTSTEVIKSDPIDLHLQSSRESKLKQVLTVELTAAVQHHLRTSHARIEFFAIVKPAHLEKLQKADILRSMESYTVTEEDTSRRPDSQLVVEQNHDLIAKVTISELDLTGWNSTPVLSLSATDGGAFFLRQGLQRRLKLDISHNSGKVWKFKISKVTIGNARLLDSYGRIHSDHSTVKDIELKSSKRTITTYSQTSFTSSWDSSLHESQLLDRTTTPGGRVLLELKFEVESDSSSEPVVFATDITLTINGRDDKAPSRFMNLLTSTRTLETFTSIFAVKFSPTISKSPAELWRLNTAEVFVRKEELLLDWKPRGLSLIRDYFKKKSEREKIAEVQAIQAVFEAAALILPGPMEGIEPMDRIRNVIELWKRSSGSKNEITLHQRSPTNVLNLSTTTSPPLPINPKFTGSVKVVPRSESYSKKGPLLLLSLGEVGENEWKKFHCVIRQPYLFIYENSGEVHLSELINLSTARAEHSPEIETMLGQSLKEKENRGLEKLIRLSEGESGIREIN